MKKFLDIITHNWGLKLLAIILAIIFWLIVVNVNDPQITKQFTVEVTVKNENVITDMGKVYEVLDDSNMCTFKVTASRSVMDSIDSSDFKATADMGQVEGMSLVPIEIKANKYSNRISITKITQNMQISVEDAITKQFVINPLVQGTPADGYAVGETSVNPNVITVTGAKSVVSEIESVKATISVQGMSENIKDKVKPVFYDGSGNVIESDNFTLSQKKVTVKANLVDQKSVDIVFEPEGTPKEGYEVTSVLCSPTSIGVQGKDSVLADLTEINLPSSLIDVSGAKKDISVDVDISDYLPSGVSLTDSEENTITIAVTIEKVASKSYDIPMDNLAIKNLSADLQSQYDQKKVRVTILGKKADLSSLKATDITGTIDAQGLGEGTYQLPVVLNLDEDTYSLKKSVKVQVTLVSTKSDTGHSQEDGENNSE